MSNATTLPFQNLIAYQVARELLVFVREANISDARLRDQALRAAASACLNIAEAAGRVTAADKARVYGIARGEASEATAALDVAIAAGWCTPAAAAAGASAGTRLFALLTALSRKVA
ncbi:MAG TPA: four helix bundle protein [Myxococcales bacterium]|nr:four helix bundle protein [Myxococcales bacterium]